MSLWGNGLFCSWCPSRLFFKVNRILPENLPLGNKEAKHPDSVSGLSPACLSRRPPSVGHVTDIQNPLDVICKIWNLSFAEKEGFNNKTFQVILIWSMVGIFRDLFGFYHQVWKDSLETRSNKVSFNLSGTTYVADIIFGYISLDL